MRYRSWVIAEDRLEAFKAYAARNCFDITSIKPCGEEIRDGKAKRVKVFRIEAADPSED